MAQQQKSKETLSIVDQISKLVIICQLPLDLVKERLSALLADNPDVIHYFYSNFPEYYQIMLNDIQKNKRDLLRLKHFKNVANDPKKYTLTEKEKVQCQSFLNKKLEVKKAPSDNKAVQEAVKSTKKLALAFLKKEYKQIPRLVEQKADINFQIQASPGEAPIPLIHLATNAEFSKEALEALLGVKGIDIEILYLSQTPLISAVSAGSVEKAQLLIDHSCNVNALNMHGVNALHTAVDVGSLEIVKILCKAKINGNQVSDEGFTPLFLAMRNINWKIVQELIEPKYNFDITIPYKGFSPLRFLLEREQYGLALKIIHDRRMKLVVDDDRFDEIDFAASHGLVDIIRAFHQVGLFKVNQKNLYGDYYFNVAIAAKQWNLVSELLNLEYQTNIAAEGNISVLVSLLKEKQLDLLKRAIRHPSMKRFSDEELRNFTSLLMNEQQIEILALLREVGLFDCNAEHSEGFPQIFAAVSNNKNELIRFLLADPKIQVNARNKHDETPLIAAAISECSEALELLLEYKNTEVSAVNNVGNNALFFAAKTNHVKNIRLLLEKDKSLIQQKNKDGHTALHFAIGFESIEVIKYLHKHYPEAFLDVDNNGWNVLQHAVFSRSERIIKYIVSHYPEFVLCEDIYGFPPIFFAAREDVLNAVLEPLRKLSEQDPCYKDCLTFPLLHIAAASDAVASVEYLLTLPEISIDAVDEGCTALHAAAIKQCFRTMKVLLQAGANPDLLSEFGYTAQQLARLELDKTSSASSSTTTMFASAEEEIDHLFKKEAKPEVKAVQTPKTTVEDRTVSASDINSSSSESSNNSTRSKKKPIKIKSWNEFIATLVPGANLGISKEDYPVSIAETMRRRNSKCEIKIPLGQPGFFLSAKHEFFKDNAEKEFCESNNYFYLEFKAPAKPRFVFVEPKIIKKMGIEKWEIVKAHLQKGTCFTSTGNGIKPLVDYKSVVELSLDVDFRILGENNYIEDILKLPGRTVTIEKLTFNVFAPNHAAINRQADLVNKNASQTGSARLK